MYKKSKTYDGRNKFNIKGYGNDLILLTELRISDFQHFHRLAGHRLSVHIPAVPNMVKERVRKRAENIFAAVVIK